MNIQIGFRVRTTNNLPDRPHLQDVEGVVDQIDCMWPEREGGNPLIPYVLYTVELPGGQCEQFRLSEFACIKPPEL